MAPAKRGAPASVKLVRHDGTPTHAAKKAVNSANWRAGQKAIKDELLAAQPQVPERVKKASGKSNSDVQVIRTGRRGRPSIAYTDELDAELFDLIVSGLSLDKISRLPHMPSVPVLLTWIGTKEHKFSFTYARAKSLLVPLYEERAQDAALDPMPGVIKTRRQAITKDGDVVTLEEERIVDSVERSKLVASVYQWSLGWLVPKKHGRQALPTTGEGAEQLEALFQSLKIEAQ